LVLPIKGCPPLDEPSITSYLQEICPPQRWKSFQETMDLDFAYSLGDKARFRANYYRHVNGTGAVFRTIPSKSLTLDDLKTPDIVRELACAHHGLILVTGPTGSGKSTTLAAMVNHINENFSKKILTIEEPVEFIHANNNSVIVQREVGVNTPSFKQALKDAARSDLDVVLVGEMRDYETISLALSAAEKGLLVFGTLLTSNATKTVDRIVDVFPANQQEQCRSQLSGCLTGVVSQLLCKTADGNGRVAAQEILMKCLSLSNLIRDGLTNRIKSVIQTGRGQGMILMDDVLETYVNEGKITGIEAYRKAIEKERFQRYNDQAQFHQTP